MKSKSCKVFPVNFKVPLAGEDERVWNEHRNETFDHSGPFLASDVHENSTKQVFITMLFFVFLHIPSLFGPPRVEVLVAVFIPYSLVFPALAHWVARYRPKTESWNEGPKPIRKSPTRFD